ncbi:hypothetical protein CRG98_038104 [Punica granatum]|uniref:Uncharacterized protein n=1 Tax=Punica granatum TaxID=22663 RepID=A0A2I0IBZ2_PUNGR|nr:hypothetical protein CRG98_038104 [Punica granatum]
MGWTGPTVSHWAELGRGPNCAFEIRIGPSGLLGRMGRWLLDWTTVPGPNCWADPLDSHGLGARIGLLDHGRGGPSDGGDWPRSPTSRDFGGLLRNRVRDSVRIRTVEDKSELGEPLELGAEKLELWFFSARASCGRS